MSTKYQKEKAETISEMFGQIAKNYDFANSILSFGLHKSWNKELVKTTLKSSHTSYLDLCAGTGDIALIYLKKQQSAQKEVYLLDFSKEMLSIAKLKAQKLKLDQSNIHYLHADAQEIPLPNQSVEAVTVAYGIRNVKDPSTCFKDVYRVLKNGGHFGILELTRPKNKLLNAGHSFYLKSILPFLGSLITKNKEAYSYLSSSIQSFVEPSDLIKELKKAGFSQFYVKPLYGGLATIIFSKKL